MRLQTLIDLGVRRVRRADWPIADKAYVLVTADRTGLDYGRTDELLPPSKNVLPVAELMDDGWFVHPSDPFVARLEQFMTEATVSTPAPTAS